jgi:type I restriction enzyme S subunit
MTEVPFDKTVKRIIDNRGKTCPTALTGTPLIATNCIKNDQLHPVFEKVRYVDDETMQNWFRGHPAPGDILFVTKGSPGRVAWVPGPVNFCIAQDMVSLRVDETVVNAKYLFAALRSPEIQATIESLHVGSLIPHFKKGDFHRLSIPVPSNELQVFTGELYFTISEKIDLLHRQNETLEQLGETLFRQWFETDDETSKHGLVSDLFTLQRGYDLPIQNRTDGSYPIISSSGIVGYHNQFKVDGPCVITGRSGVIGNVFYTNEKCWPLNTSLYISQFKFGTPLFAYFMLKRLDLLSLNAGSAVPTLNRNHVHELPVSLPIRSKLLEFEQYAGSLFEKINANELQISSLQQLRDTLLPKLMSGELRVVDAVEMIA